MRERHKAIYDAIKARDPEAAGKAMAAHFDELRRTLVRLS
jgi:DNA-binding FadR family transcriptional regulator